MTAAAAQTLAPITIERADLSASILLATGRDSLVLRAGTVVTVDSKAIVFEADTPVTLTAPVAGTDYGVFMDGATPTAFPLAAGEPIPADFFAGFHFAPAGNAQARAGGDGAPAINPFSCWDLGFRPACADPRGMALVELPGGKLFWADIYLLGVDHLKDGTSRCGATIADGRSRPMLPDGSGKADKLDYPTAVAIYARHGKQILGAEEFFAAAFGVAERQSRSDEPERTGELDDDAIRFVSARGLFDATGTMWQWGTDGDPDNPRPSIFGGSWFYGSGAGSRCADLDVWPGYSVEVLSARGRSDHLSPETARAEARA